MNIEKLKPWNWFKHEDNGGAQIPVSKTEVAQGSGTQPLAPRDSVNSLLQLHRQMDRLFDDVWSSFGLAPLSGRAGLTDRQGADYRANLDIAADDKGYEVTIDLPGLTEEDIQLEVTGHTMAVRGAKEERHENKDKHYYRMERTYGAFCRTLSLPDDAEASDITAKMKNGVLSISVPRRPTTPQDVKRIAIST